MTGGGNVEFVPFDRDRSSSSSGASRTIRVLHIDDDPAFLDLSTDVLESEMAGFHIETAASPEAGLEAVEAGEFDCVVCDYDLPRLDGLEVLERVRAIDSALPFILFTGKGSEEIASEAISKGVSDYLQKGTGLYQFRLLANRIENQTERVRAVEAVERTETWYSKLLATIPGYVFVVDPDGLVSYCTPSIERVMGYAPEVLVGRSAFEFTHPEDIDDAVDGFSQLLADPGSEVTITFRAEAADGTYRTLEVEGRNRLDDPVIEGAIVTVRDVTDRAE